jgi:hypothetical protein
MQIAVKSHLRASGGRHAPQCALHLTVLINFQRRPLTFSQVDRWVSGWMQTSVFEQFPVLTKEDVVDAGTSLQYMLQPEFEVPKIIKIKCPEGVDWDHLLHLSKFASKEEKTRAANMLKTNEDLCVEFGAKALEKQTKQKEKKMKLKFKEVVCEVTECVGEDYIFSKIKEIPIDILMEKLFNKEEVLNIALLKQKDLICLDSQE